MIRYIPLQIRHGRGLNGDVDGWRVLVISILLNRTGRYQVTKVLDEFFEAFPDAWAVVAMPDLARKWMQPMVSPLGFGTARTDRIVRFSQEWVEHPEWRNVRMVDRFIGCGAYAVESWRIFVDDDYSVPAGDKVLEEWRMQKNGEQREREVERSTGTSAQDSRATDNPVSRIADRGNFSVGHHSRHGRSDRDPRRIH